MPKRTRRAKASVLNAKQYRQTASEHSTQAALLKYLILNAQRDIFWFAIPNAGKRTPRYASWLKQEGMLKGTPDLCVMLPQGRTGWLEMKTPKGKQSHAQQWFQERCELLEHKYALARTFDEAITVLRQWGALKEAK